MKELYRVMKPGGFGIFQVPIDYTREETLEDPNINTPELREKYYWQKDHVRLYGKDYPKRLEQAGFKVKAVDYQSELGKELCQRYRLTDGEILYVCFK
jgi:predicted SAM-dependent methyltransferase